MPELPEVETVRRGLEPVLVGKRIVRVELRRPDLRFPLPENFAARIEGRKITALERRAKYLLAHLSGGEVLVMHLGMSGRFLVTEPRHAAPALLGDFTYATGRDPEHDHVVFTVEGGAKVTYNDPRRFGFMLLIPEAELNAHPLFAGLGVEPLSDQLNPAYLAARARGRKADLKAFLMDQRVIAGLGNIYACEALFQARLRPTRSAACLATPTGKPTSHAVRLVEAIKTVLERALAAGGSTLRDYRRADGKEGAFQHEFAVYGREGEPCPTPGCRGIVRRSVQGGRSTFYCPSCQR
jgi:formamidopyrimidine-DNA glycosylase